MIKRPCTHIRCCAHITCSTIREVRASFTYLHEHFARLSSSNENTKFIWISADMLCVFCGELENNMNENVERTTANCYHYFIYLSSPSMHWTLQSLTESVLYHEDVFYLLFITVCAQRTLQWTGKYNYYFCIGKIKRWIYIIIILLNRQLQFTNERDGSKNEKHNYAASEREIKYL